MLKHPNILPLLGVVFEDELPSFVSEWMDGTLYWNIHHHPEVNTLSMVRSMVVPVAYNIIMKRDTIAGTGYCRWLGISPHERCHLCPLEQCMYSFIVISDLIFTPEDHDHIFTRTTYSCHMMAAPCSLILWTHNLLEMEMVQMQQTQTMFGLTKDGCLLRSLDLLVLTWHLRSNFRWTSSHWHLMFGPMEWYFM